MLRDTLSRKCDGKTPAGKKQLKRAWKRHWKGSLNLTQSSRKDIMTEVPANRSVPSGYDEQFVNPPDEDLQCIICYLPSKRTSSNEMWS